MLTLHPVWVCMCVSVCVCCPSDSTLATIHVLSTWSDIVPLGIVSKEVLFSLKGEEKRKLHSLITTTDTEGYRLLLLKITAENKDLNFKTFKWSDLAWIIVLCWLKVRPEWKTAKMLHLYISTELFRMKCWTLKNNHSPRDSLKITWNTTIKINPLWCSSAYLSAR